MSRDQAPPGPPGALGLRNLYGFSTNALEFLTHLRARYGDIVRLKLLGKPWFLISHPDDIESVLVKHSKIMVRDEYVTILERTLGLGLLTSDGELWRRQRRLMASAFTPKKIRGYAEAMVRVADHGLRAWRHGAEINLHQEMSRVTMEVVAEVLFGAGISPADVVTVREAMDVINEFYANSPEAIAKLPAWVPTPRNRRMTRAVEAIDALLYRIIKERRSSEAPIDDLLSTLLAAQDDDGASMSDQQLRDEAVTLFLAGHETTSLALSHTLYALSKYPDVGRRVYQEVRAVLGDRPPTAEDVDSLVYTGRVLKESMRLYPPVWTTGREAGEDVVIGGYHVPKGAQLLLSQWVVHRDPRWFPNPEAFDPDRWKGTDDLPRFAYFPFGGGPRVCIGNHFAMMEATLLLTIIVQRFQLDLLPGERLSFSPSVTLRQTGPGLRMRLIERDPAPHVDRDEDAEGGRNGSSQARL